MEILEGDGYETEDKKERIKIMEGERHRILKYIQEQWRLKSRAIWLEVGDENYKVFQNYLKGKKNSYTIWEMKKVDGGSANSFADLAALSVYHFKSFFKAPREATITEVIRVSKVFPSFV